MTSTPNPADRPGRWPGGLWWAGPTALALLGASVVSLLLVPGSTERATVPQQVVVARAAPDRTPVPDRISRPHPRPTATPDDETDEPTVVVTPSRDVESESPEPEHGGGDGDRDGDRR